MALCFVALLHLFFAGLGRCQYGKEIIVDPAKHNEHFFTFRSRPDIESPRWDFKIYDQSAVAPGYWFVSPYALVEQKTNDHRWVAPSIFDSTNGELIWNGGREQDYFDVFNLEVVYFNHGVMLSFLQPEESQGVIMDKHYSPIRHVRTGTIGVRENMHEFQIVDDGLRALFLNNNRKKISREESRFFDFDGECEVLFLGIEERDLDTDEITFKWDSQEHIPLSESYAHPIPEGFPNYNNTQFCFDGWGVDYIHGNSVEKLPDGDYLLSARHMFALYKISHKDGSIVWRLGGKHSDFTLADDLHFSAQHDARCTFQNSTHMTITMLDNAVGVWEDVGYTSNPVSRGLVVSVNTETMVATELAHYDHPDGIGTHAFERGNLQTLPNGNIFITWTHSGHHTEYTPDGTVVEEARFLTNLKTYRSFKFPWVGHGRIKPDVYSEVVPVGADGELQTVVYVSWNGDTQAAQWRLYGTEASGDSPKLLNTTEKTGFETIITHKGYLAFIKVDALDGAGTFLDKSESDAIRTVFLPEAEATSVQTGATIIDSPIPSDGAWNSLEDIPTDPVMVFLAGTFFGALLLLVVRKMHGRWPNVLQRGRRRSTYTALEDDEEKRGWAEDAGLLRESGENLTLAERAHPGAKIVTHRDKSR